MFFNQWKGFLRWLDGKGVTALADVTHDLLESYRQHVGELDIHPTGKSNRLVAVARLHAFADELPPEDRLPEPGWIKTGFRFRTGGASGPNATAVIDPHTMDPLLTWALIFVREIAPDGLAAKAEATRLLSAIPASTKADTASGRWGGTGNPQKAATAAWLADYLANHNGVLPGRMNQGTPGIATLYLSAMHGFRPLWISKVARERFEGQYTLDLEADNFVDVPIQGRIHGQPWTRGINFYDVVLGPGGGAPFLVRMLEAAVLVTVGYLSGMRPHELLLLEPGCTRVVPPPAEDPEGVIRYFIRGAKRKGVVKDGEKDPEGKETLWGTLRPAVDAIKVAEALAGDSKYLFPSARRGAMATEVAGARVTEFVDYANRLVAELGLPEAYRIPEDPNGDIDLSRFRRSIAWHIENQPGGEFALAVQYQHAGTVLGRDGYASAGGVGIQKMMGVEKARAIIETFRQLDQALTGGLGVSGPAADRLIEATEKAKPLLAAYVGEKEAKGILADPDLQIHDNPGAYSLCVYKAANAKCHSQNGPDRANCKADCDNHARTDIQISRLRLDELRHRAESQSPLVPEPLALRLGHKADEARARIDSHQASRRIMNSQAPEAADDEEEAS